MSGWQLKVRTLGVLVPLTAAGAVLAQGQVPIQVPAEGGVSNPTELEAEVVGPQDSIGTSGSSPTKGMIYVDPQERMQGRRPDEAVSAAPGTFPAGGATEVSPYGTSGDSEIDRKPPGNRAPADGNTAGSEAGQAAPVPPTHGRQTRPPG